LKWNKCRSIFHIHWSDILEILNCWLAFHVHFLALLVTATCNAPIFSRCVLNFLGIFGSSTILFSKNHLFNFWMVFLQCPQLVSKLALKCLYRHFSILYTETRTKVISPLYVYTKSTKICCIKMFRTDNAVFKTEYILP
jgi:hypothetical protein